MSARYGAKCQRRTYRRLKNTQKRRDAACGVIVLVCIAIGGRWAALPAPAADSSPAGL
jgi:hypothetical protein